ncbi:hypothetical protein [Allokutzneria oryzae]|uniref:Uncharacterized protein n=1 Tax=Allokutzneria oryzae TaxID=1378989 RepID=A0ABV5ZXD3_9PSEU
MAQERDRLTEHIDDLVHTREVLDTLIASNRALRASQLFGSAREVSRG